MKSPAPALVLSPPRRRPSIPRACGIPCSASKSRRTGALPSFSLRLEANNTKGKKTQGRFMLLPTCSGLTLRPCSTTPRSCVCDLANRRSNYQLLRGLKVPKASKLILTKSGTCLCRDASGFFISPSHKAGHHQRNMQNTRAGKQHLEYDDHLEHAEHAPSRSSAARANREGG